MVVLGTGGLTVTSPEVQNMHPIQLHLIAESVRASEGRFAKMLGKHLGSHLDLDTLESLFYPPIPEREETDEPVETGTSVFSPLLLAIRPEMAEKLKEQTRAMIQGRDDKFRPDKLDPGSVGFDVDEATFEMLQAVSRMADAQKTKETKAGPKWDEESDRRSGIDGHEVR